MQMLMFTEMCEVIKRTHFLPSSGPVADKIVRDSHIAPFARLQFPDTRINNYSIIHN